MKPQVRDDYDLASEVFGRLLTAYLERRSFYAGVTLPQRFENLPSNLAGPREHALHLTFVNEYMQGGVSSEHAFKAFKQMHESYPEMFLPEEIIKISEEEIRKALKEVGLGHYNSRPKWRRHNAQVLLDLWGGDPRNIYLDLPDDPILAWEELLARVMFKSGKNPKGLMGTQEKIAAMHPTFLVDARLIATRQYAMPFDFHLLRLLTSVEATWLGTSIGSWNELNAIRDAGRDLGLRYCLEHNVLFTLLSEALWTYSQLACRYAPGNRTATGEYAARSTIITHPGFDENNPSEVEAFAKTCGRCLIRDLCKWNVPQAYYYRQGKLELFPRKDIPVYYTPELSPDLVVGELPCDKHRRLWVPDQTGTCAGCGACSEGRESILG